MINSPILTNYQIDYVFIIIPPHRRPQRQSQARCRRRRPLRHPDLQLQRRHRARLVLDLDRSSTILYAVDIRSRLNPPPSRLYAENAVLTAYATTKCRDLEEESWNRAVEMVTEGAMRMTDEYARSTIDWGEWKFESLIPIKLCLINFLN